MGRAPTFTEGDIERIATTLPEGNDPRRLAFLLREWSAVELQRHLEQEAPEKARDRRKRLQRLADALDKLNDRERIAIVFDLFRLAGVPEPLAGPPHDRRFDFLVVVVENLASAAREGAKAPRGRPRGIAQYLILKDLAAIFENVTGQRASRIVNPDTGEETGPFCSFAREIWQIVFRSDTGLAGALRNWVRYRDSESSAVIANIAMRMEKIT
jgi:hypothetical protein